MTRRAALTASAAVLGVAGLVLPALPASAASGIETFQIFQTTASNATVIGNGPIHAMGKDVQVSDTKDVFKFPKGNVLVTHKKKSERSTYDKATCLGTDHETGTFAVTGGTGSYAKAKGAGNYVVDVTFVGCDPKKAPTVLIVKIVARGPLSF